MECQELGELGDVDLTPKDTEFQFSKMKSVLWMEGGDDGRLQCECT